MSSSFSTSFRKFKRIIFITSGFFLALVGTSSPRPTEAQSIVELTLIPPLVLQDGATSIAVPGLLVGLSQQGRLVQLAEVDAEGKATFHVAPGDYTVGCVSCSDSTFSPQFSRFVLGDTPTTVRVGTQPSTVTIPIATAPLSEFSEAIRRREVRGEGFLSKAFWQRATNLNRKPMPTPSRAEIAAVLRLIGDNTASFAQNFQSADDAAVLREAHEILRMQGDCDPDDQDLENCPLIQRMKAQFLSASLSLGFGGMISKDPPTQIDALPPESKPASASWLELYLKIIDQTIVNSARFSTAQLREALRSNRALNRQLAQLPRNAPDLVTTITTDATNPTVGTPYLIHITLTNEGNEPADELTSVLLRLASGKRVESGEDDCPGLVFPEPSAGINAYLCQFPALEPGRSATITVTITASQPGDSTDRAISANPDDHDWRNNPAAVAVRVSRGNQGVSVSLPDVPAEVETGREATITVRVDNTSSVSVEGGTVRITLVPEPERAATISTVVTADGTVEEVREDHAIVRLTPVRPADSAEVATTISVAAPGRATFRVELESNNFEPVRTEASIRLVSPVTVTITSPANNSTVSNQISVAYDASANVVRTEFYVDEVLVDTQTPPLGTFEWDSRTVEDGPHSLTVKVADSQGREASSTVTVTVSNPVRLTAPNVPPSIASGQPTKIRITVENRAVRMVSGTFTITVIEEENVRTDLERAVLQDGVPLVDCSVEPGRLSCPVDYEPGVHEIEYGIISTLIIFTEFGRTAVENSSAGTDHGDTVTIELQVVSAPRGPVCGDQVCDVDAGECNSCPEDCTRTNC